jgi:hypothetical protein
MDALSPVVVIADVEDVRTIGRKGTGRGRAEVLGRERRRNWTAEQKRTIVAESLGSGLTPTEVARKYAISSGLLYSWRQQVLGGQISVVTGSAANFARVGLGPALPASNGSEPGLAGDSCTTSSLTSGWDNRSRAAEWRLGTRGCRSGRASLASRSQCTG